VAWRACALFQRNAWVYIAATATSHPMFLRTMLQRLQASLTSGPGLNARPHYSRQRLDLMELGNLLGTDPATLLPRLVAPSGGAVEFPARVPVFEKPSTPEREWTDSQKEAAARWEGQSRLLQKVRDIAEDAVDYYNDHGEHALFVGFPLLSLPPSAAAERQGLRSQRILAPLTLIPVNLRVRRGAGAGATLEPAGDGAEFIQPNPALLAWIEQHTGQGSDHLFHDEAGEDPWREIEEVVALVARAAGIDSVPHFPPEMRLQPVPRTDALPSGPAILPCAVLGLFPFVNPGLLRDTKWMQENESSLANPVRTFLRPEALVMSSVATQTMSLEPMAAGADPPSRSAGGRDFTSEWHVTHADPCQAAAVAHARSSDALVVHGPPGTGKSQTIANIIGDHLARGERVLFVCDKRTALDVVKFRLDSMGLGPLCGVIHDPQRDRRALYLGMRERLENLAQDPVLPAPASQLELVNRRLGELDGELRRAFDQLHGKGAGGGSFHELCGEWFSLYAGNGGVKLPEIDEFRLDELQAHRADAEEILGRAIAARWPESPYRNRLAMTLPAWLAAAPGEVHRVLIAAVDAARQLDRQKEQIRNALPLEESVPSPEQASARRELADQLEAVAGRGLFNAGGALAQESQWRRWSDEVERLNVDGQLLDPSLDRELHLQAGTPPPIAEVAQHQLALEKWAGLATKWTRFFAFGARKAAAAAVARVALPLTPETVERARSYYRALKARLLWSDLVHRLEHLALAGNQAAAPVPLRADAELLALRDGLPALFALLAAAELPGNASVRHELRAAFRSAATAAELGQRLRTSVEWAEWIHQLEDLLARSQLFTSAAIEEWARGWRRGTQALGLAESLVAFEPTLEGAIRLKDRLCSLPEPMQQALNAAAERGLPWSEAEPVLRAMALAKEIRRRLRDDPDIAAIDSQRVSAAFAESLERRSEKVNLVRQHILHWWQDRWRARLLATTGSRLNSLGASLRQRLFVRGQKAMKLRPMIAAGAGSEGGDPLFDLCPVWMAAPATVAQIFPRATCFDVIVFDEASQCRLEEALPVLLRGKRVVIAGDPQQLPPTRFFEVSLAESDEASAETLEEVFVQQQSEAEDLLSAALNLNVQEAFLDVHYRSRHEALISFSNASFYGGRLQPIPGHPQRREGLPPVRLIPIDGTYQDRGNEAEAAAAARLVADLLSQPEPPSIGVACFNLNQRDLLLDALDDLAAGDAAFAERLAVARERRGADSFEGLFVKNLENVQGDERDHLIISTTFGPDPQGKFRRNFGALSRAGGERRLNVLVTRARERVHVLTSIPPVEYRAPVRLEEGKAPTGRHYLYAYLRAAEELASAWQEVPSGDLNPVFPAKSSPEARTTARTVVRSTGVPSAVAEALARQLLAREGSASTVYWGNDGFCVDVALPGKDPQRSMLGILTDFTRYRRTPDPIAWEQFRSAILTGQGWKLHRVWSPALFREPEATLKQIPLGN
jgi:hypothetical protein